MQTNTNASLSNDFVQVPQAPMTLTETRLYNAALRCLHRKTATLDATYSIEIKQLHISGSAGYVGLNDAITSLLSRRWFGEPLFLRLERVHKEGAIDFQFNSALRKHLLHDDGWYTAIDLAELEARGLRNPVAFRLLWVLRSYYRPLAAVKQKVLTVAELHSLLFNGERSFEGFSRLKQCISVAVKNLCAIGIELTATTKKRGLIAKGITFTIPALALKRKKSKTARLVEVAEQTLTVMKEAAVAAVAAEPTPVPVKTKTVSYIPAPAPTTVVGPLTHLITRAIGSHTHAAPPQHEHQPVPPNTFVVGQKATFRENLTTSHKKLLAYKLTKDQADRLCKHVYENECGPVFFKAMHKLGCEISTITPKYWAGHVVKELKSALNFTF